MVDEFPMGNHSLTDIINLKQLHNLLCTVICCKVLFNFVETSIIPSSVIRNKIT